MVEITEVNVAIEREEMGKVENDRSYKYHDSGLSSNDGLTTAQTSRDISSGYDSGSTKSTEESWIKVENEVVDPKSFNPPCFQSTDLVPRSKIWDISSIENVGLLPKSSKGTDCDIYNVMFMLF